MRSAIPCLLRPFRFSVHLLIALVCITPLFAPPPSWWTESQTAILDSTITDVDNYAPANLGQLKHVAKQAKLHLDQNLSGGAGPAITSLVNGFEPREGQGYTQLQKDAFIADNYAPINLGQLKAVAKPFYDRLLAAEYDTKANLIARGYPSGWVYNYPWDPTTPVAENLAPANLGQLKMIFSFDVTDFLPSGWDDWIDEHFPSNPGTDTDGDADDDGASNIEEYYAGTNPNNSDSDGDGLSDGWEVANGYDPTDPYNGAGDSILGHWTLDGPSQVTDVSGKGNHAIRYGTILSIPAMVDTGAFIDSTSKYFQTPVPNQTTATLAAWIKPRSSDDVAWIESVIDTDISSQYGTGWGLDNGYFKVILDDQFWTTDVAVTLNRWQHVALTYDASTAKLYVDGVLRASLVYTQSSSITPATYRIGRSFTNSLGFDGAIDEVRIYDRILTSEEIALIHQGTFMDEDGDGLSDAEENQLNTNPNDPDSDYDGRSDSEEIDENTNPLDPESFTPVRLGYWNFNGTFNSENGRLPLTNESNSLANSGWGQALNVTPNGNSLLKYRDIEPNGKSNFNLRRGSIRLWFKPSWSSTANGGTGPESWARIFEIGRYTAPSTYGFWALVLSPQGEQLTLNASNENNQGNGFFWHGISWKANEWHQIVLTYTPTSTNLYIDGTLAATATDNLVYPNAEVRGEGITIGTNWFGTERTRAIIDEIETFNYPLTPAEIAADYATRSLPIIDIDNNGLADVWEIEHFSTIGQDPSADSDGDGFTNLQEFEAGTDPQDYYSQPGGAFTPHVTISGGNNQTGFLNSFLSSPLEVEVRKNPGGALLVNAPVQFTVTGGGGKIAETDIGSQSLFTSLEVRTNQNGIAGVFHKLPSVTATGNRVTATAGVGTPVEFSSNSIWSESKAQIAAGGFHSLALAEDGRMWAWGSNNQGQLGDGSTEGQRSSRGPVPPVSGMGRIVKIAAGDRHNAAISEFGTLWMWGSNENGRLGIGSTVNESRRPTKVVFPSLTATQSIVDVSCSESHTIALDSEGNVWAWGRGTNGRLGNNSTLDRYVPVQVTKPANMGAIVSVAAGRESSYALAENGKVWAWGSNTNGRLGDGTTDVRTTPVLVGNSTVTPLFKEIASNSSHALALALDNSIWTWGANNHGQLGINSSSHRTLPERILTGPVGSIALAGGGTHSLAVAGNGAVWAWGYNNNGQLGNNLTVLSPVPILTLSTTGLVNAISVSASIAHSLALKADGSIMGWGFNSSGQLGVGTHDTQRLSPVTTVLLKLIDDDSDNDGLADSWEQFYIGNLSSSNSTISPGGHLTLLQKYQQGLNPIKSDTDGDGMPDHWEIAQGFDPLNPRDALENWDGDSIPNVYEYANNTDPFDSESYPSAHIIVDRAFNVETPTQKKSIQAAINASPTISANPTQYTIISVKSDTYIEAITINDRRLLLLGEEGAIPPILERAPGFTYGLQINEHSVALDGFDIRRGGTAHGSGVFISLDKATDEVRLSNCIISGHVATNGGGVHIGRGIAQVTHCTIVENTALTSGRGIFLSSSDSSLILENSIIWNPEGIAPQEVYAANGSNITTRTNIIKGGEHHGINADPILDLYFGLMPGSPALGVGTPGKAASSDIHGELRPMLNPDLGADQRVDSDSDSLPDHWELHFFSNLAYGSEDDPDDDDLKNYYEYLFGFDPNDSDTTNRGYGDLWEAAVNFGGLWHLSTWLEDPDNDGLNTGVEILYGTDPSNPSSTGTGILDGVIFMLGFDFGNNDWDADGLTNQDEILIGTNPFLNDTDGDGELDGQDAFPLDPSRWELPVGNSGDVIAPEIVLFEPVDAVLVP